VTRKGYDSGGFKEFLWALGGDKQEQVDKYPRAGGIVSGTSTGELDDQGSLALRSPVLPSHPVRVRKNQIHMNTLPGGNTADV
jgi:hypothetical protein